MTPEEIKAKELIDKYRGVAKYGQRQWGQISYAKQSAIICVDEILINLHWLEDSINSDKAIPFWQKVKQAIQDL